MSASRLAPEPGSEATETDCGPWRGAGGWIVVPLVLLGTAVTVWFLAVVYRVGPFGGTPPAFPFFWPVFPFGFFLLFFVLFWALRWSWWGPRRGPYGYGGYASPKEIIRRRYARGEITREQYVEMSRTLEQT